MSGLQEATHEFDHRVAEGRFRRFGPFGPAYEIVETAGDVTRVRVTESGEEFDYPTAQVREDPEA